MPGKARGADNEAQDAKRSGKSDDERFKVNYDMLMNVFRTGVSKSSASFREKTQFPFELDKFQNSIRSFSINRTFDSDSAKW